MTQRNLKSIIVALILMSIGSILALVDAYVWKSPSALLVSIGCSLLASGLVLLLTTLLIDYDKPNPVDVGNFLSSMRQELKKRRRTTPNLIKQGIRWMLLLLGLVILEVDTAIRWNPSFVEA